MLTRTSLAASSARSSLFSPRWLSAVPLAVLFCSAACGEGATGAAAAPSGTPRTALKGDQPGTDEPPPALGAEEQKLLAGSPSVGFLDPEIDVTGLRASFGPRAVAPGVLAWDAKPGTAPPNWRATDALDPAVAGQVDTTGLDGLHLAGSGQYDRAQLTTALTLAATTGRPLTVLHLREEPTGFIGDSPFSMYGFEDWSNAGLDKHQVRSRNRAILAAIGLAPLVAVFDKKALKAAINSDLPLPAPGTVTPAMVADEKDLVEAAGGEFERVMITDHGRPTSDQVDDLVEVIAGARAEGRLLYVHCAGGDGRTTTVMAMADMLLNAPHGITLAQILARQAAIGGEDLTVTTDPGARGQLQVDRLAFLNQFYQYAAGAPDPGTLSFSDWAQAQQLPTYQPHFDN
jgi:hypothetical protein